MEYRKTRQQEKEGGGVGRENEFVIQLTLCHKLTEKDAKLQAHSVPWVRYCSSNKVNNCFTLMHTLVLLEAKLLSCCSWQPWYTLPAGESVKIVAKIPQYSHQA